MIKQDEIIRKSFGLKEQVRPELEATYHSSLINQIKAEGFRFKSGRFTFRLAEEFGFCYGVDRAIDYAYETRAKFPNRRIIITNEIIHNPQVNSKLQELGIQFLFGPYAKGLSIEDIGKDDVVIIPAFGTPVKELSEIQKRGCVLVDTTCGSVMSVWKRVESYSRDGFTSVIHGKYDHDVRIWEHLLRNFSNKNDFFIILKPHPQEKNIDIYKKFLNENKSKNFKIIQGNILELIHISSLVVSVFSSTMLDSLCFKKPVIRVKFEDENPIFDRTDAVLKTNLESLSSNILEILENEETKNNLLKKGKEFVFAHYGIPEENISLKIRKILGIGEKNEKFR